MRWLVALLLAALVAGCGTDEKKDEATPAVADSTASDTGIDIPDSTGGI